MGERRKIAQIKVANYGMAKIFRLKDYNRSTAAGYTVTITIWHMVPDPVTGVPTVTKIVDEVVCLAVPSGSDTLVTYIPTAATIFTTLGDYDAEITFTKVGIYVEDCKTVAWRVIPSSH